MLSRYCVRLSVDKNKAQSRRGLDRLIPPDKPTRYYLLSPEGKILEEIFPTTGPRDASQLVRLVEQTARRLGIEARKAPPTPLVQEVSVVEGGALTHASRSAQQPTRAAAHEQKFRVTARFLDLREVQAPAGRVFRYPPYPAGLATVPLLATTMYLRTAAPVGSVETLKAADVGALLPPPEKRHPGMGYALPEPVTKQLLYQFRPPTHFNNPQPDDLTRAWCQARIRSLVADRVDLALWGEVVAPDPWFPSPWQLGPAVFVEHQANAKVAGYARLRLSSGALESLTMATGDAWYTGEDGTLLPFACTLESVGEKPALEGGASRGGGCEGEARSAPAMPRS